MQIMVFGETEDLRPFRGEVFGEPRQRESGAIDGAFMDGALQSLAAREELEPQGLAVAGKEIFYRHRGYGHADKMPEPPLPAN